MIAVARDMAAKKRASRNGASDPRRPNNGGESARKKPSDLRFGTRTVESLREDAKLLERLIADLKGALDGAAAIGVTELYLDGVTKGDRAIKLLRAFVPNVKHAIEKEEYRQM